MKTLSLTFIDKLKKTVEVRALFPRHKFTFPKIF